jgi:glycosyltransferase involved in cell wall biosynthesis
MEKGSPTPLVSCVMPTYNRRSFVPQAIKYFLRQEYKSKELIVVDDGDDAVGDLIPNDERITYLRLKRRASLGAKRNLGCEYARGEIIANWDDDDWQAPHRLSYQVEALQRERADLCGINDLLYYDILTADAWRYVYPPERKLWLIGSSLCYTRTCWSVQRFPDITFCEDLLFVWNDLPKRMIALPDSEFLVGIIHHHNTSTKEKQGPHWHTHPVTHIQRLMGEDWKFYQSRPTHF